MKISQDISKSTLPGKKQVYRLFDKSGIPLLDLIDVRLSVYTHLIEHTHSLMGMSLLNGGKEYFAYMY